MDLLDRIAERLGRALGERNDAEQFAAELVLENERLRLRIAELDPGAGGSL